jgi:trans-aconitate 2-methyltransferase
MGDWGPEFCHRIEDGRTHPVRELRARVPTVDVQYAVDLGCGPRNATELLAVRLAGADVTGADTSDAKLACARQCLPALRFEHGEFAAGQPARAPQLICADTSLQSVPGHGQLLPRLFEAPIPGGVQAVQMRDNRDAPSHRPTRELADRRPWAGHSADSLRRLALFIVARRRHT